MMVVRLSSKAACAPNWLLLKHLIISSIEWSIVSASNSLSALRIIFDRHTAPADYATLLELFISSCDGTFSI